MDTVEQFNTFGAVYVKDVVSPELAKFMTQALMLKVESSPDKIGDEQCPKALSIRDELMFDTLLEKAWPFVEAVIGEPLLPTYAYARLYKKGDTLEKHIDRESCEVSMTVQLGRSHHYAWPIYMGGKRFDLGEGEGIIYSGCDVEHWREACNPPDDTYYSGQVFLHFVRANGKYAEWANDKKPGVSPYKQFRAQIMEDK